MTSKQKKEASSIIKKFEDSITVQALELTMKNYFNLAANEKPN